MSAAIDARMIELDMGFDVEEVARGIERLVERSGGGGRIAEGNGFRFLGADGLIIEVKPMPAERIHYPTIFFARTLVVIRGAEEAVEAMNKKILLAFLRVGG
ncbi:MAG: hypothetical protein ACREQQ_10665 [Candidatus Binatia bacterium]